MAVKSLGHLLKGRLPQIEPGHMLGCMNIPEAIGPDGGRYAMVSR